MVTMNLTTVGGHLYLNKIIIADLELRVVKVYNVA